MQYVIITHSQSHEIGIPLTAHMVSEDHILISEMELMRNAHLQGSPAERAAQLSVPLLSKTEAERIVITEDFQPYHPTPNT